jgi:hypothetical protein
MRSKLPGSTAEVDHSKWEQGTVEYENTNKSGENAGWIGFML